MRRITVRIPVVMAFLGTLGLLVGGRALEMASAHQTGSIREPSSLLNSFAPGLTETLTPTLFVPLVFRDHDTGSPTVQFDRSRYDTYEWAGTATIVATLSTAVDATVTVDYAVSDGTARAGEDYVPVSGTLTFSPGQTIQAFTVAIINDTAAEPDEMVLLTLNNPINAVLGISRRTATLAIVDDDELVTVQFNSDNYNGYEEAGIATVIATLSTSSDVTVTVDYATSDGTAKAGEDYVATSGTLTFAPGQMSQTFTVTIVSDAVAEQNETVNLMLSNPVHADLGTPHHTATLTIVDSSGLPTVQFNSERYIAHEEAGVATVIATLSTATGAVVTVDYASSDGTAGAGEDYAAISGTLTFAPGETSQAFTLEVYNDPFDELDETLTLALSSPANAALGAPHSALLTIVDQDRPSRFGLQIAALHEMSPGTVWLQNRTSVTPQTEAEWLTLFESAYVTLTAALRDSGAGWTRVRVEWEHIEPNEPVPGQPPDYVWGPYYDTKLRLVAESGVRLLVTVADAPGWAATVPCAPIYPDRMDEFARFLTDLVNHYKGPPYFARHWELLNEPDYDGSEGPERGWSCWGNDPDQYAQMLMVAYQAIKAADPGATVLMGGLAYDRFTEYDGPFLRYFSDEMMENGGGAYVDGLNIHFFQDFHAEWDRWNTGNLPTCGLVDDGIGTPYEVRGVDLLAKASHYRNRMSTCSGVDKPLWVTEMGEHGYPDSAGSLDNQARYVVMGNVRGLAAGAEALIWYALTTPNDNWEFQLLFDDWTPKPAFRTLQALNAELSGYEYARTLDVPDVEGYVFEDASQQQKTVAWGSGTLSFAQAEQLRIVDRDGNETYVEDGGPRDEDGIQNQAVELQLSTEPLFMVVSR